MISLEELEGDGRFNTTKVWVVVVSTVAIPASASSVSHCLKVVSSDTVFLNPKVTVASVNVVGSQTSNVVSSIEYHCWSWSAGIGQPPGNMIRGILTPTGYGLTRALMRRPAIVIKSAMINIESSTQQWAARKCWKKLEGMDTKALSGMFVIDLGVSRW